MPKQMKTAAIIVAVLNIFICNCLLMKAANDKKQLNRKEGTAMVKGARTPLKPANATKSPQQEAQEA